MPGFSAADSQKYRQYFPANPLPAAVLVPLVERPKLTVLLTQRATQLRNHAGQISFPGGRIEPSDSDPKAAALREAHEEIGLDASFVSVVGYLPDHIVMTGFRVTPVVGLRARRALSCCCDRRKSRTPSRCRWTLSSIRPITGCAPPLRLHRRGGGVLRHPLRGAQHLGRDRGHAADALPSVRQPRSAGDE